MRVAHIHYGFAYCQYSSFIDIALPKSSVNFSSGDPTSYISDVCEFTSGPPHEKNFQVIANSIANEFHSVCIESLLFKTFPNTRIFRRRWCNLLHKSIE